MTMSEHFPGDQLLLFYPVQYFQDNDVGDVAPFMQQS